jgi:hypothetical protein
MATEEELRRYAESLPPIYREILAAFPRIEPTRRQGDGLAFQTLAVDFDSQGKGFSLGQIMQACEQLEQQGLIKTKHRIFAHPTPLGERIIGIITGQLAQPVTVDRLPSPPR